MKVVHGLFVAEGDEPRVDQRLSPNCGGEFDRARLLLIHYTAGRGFEQTCNWLTNPKARASANVVVGREAQLAQLVPCGVRAWHAGESAWPGHHRDAGGGRDVNGLSIGFELDNYGELRRRGDGFYTYFGLQVPENEVVIAPHKSGGPDRFWHAYTSDQILATYAMCEAAIDAYPTIEDVLGHDDVAVPTGRKVDPGPAFPMESFRAWLFGRGAG